MNRLNNLLFLLMGLIIFGCTNETPTPGPTPNPVVYDCEDNPNACDLATANNAFGFKLFQTLHQQDPLDNIFMSPLSVSTALSMTLNGADGNTKTEMEQALERIELDIATANETYEYVLNALPNMDPSVQFNIANSIWKDIDFGAYQEFLDVNQQYYNSEVQTLNFKDPASVDVINDWIKDNTEGKIEEMLQEIPNNAVMYLINALYFKGDWRYQFDPENTMTQDFTLADNTTKPVEMMHFVEEVTLPTYTNSQMSMVDLPYGDSIYSMTLLLPHPSSSLDEVIASLSAENWADWTAHLYPSGTMLSVPKFKMEYEKKLNDALVSMGMVDAFDEGKADFSKLGPTQLWISLVKHKAVLEVNEQGSEAAAVTVVEISNESVAPSLNFNRPFLLAIRENRSNSVLFMGKVMEPK